MQECATASVRPRRCLLRRRRHLRRLPRANGVSVVEEENASVAVVPALLPVVIAAHVPLLRAPNARARPAKLPRRRRSIPLRRMHVGVVGRRAPARHAEATSRTIAVADDLMIVT